ncbi:MAG TPA: hypothetical protein VFO57_11805 [Burkholderiales bacterium]|nr:hypothetical protein [Burkholderiales bacterium]
MNRTHRVLFLALAALAGGCEYAISDVATRVRYALVYESTLLDLSGKESAVITLRPDHWPDGCSKGAGYRLVLSPYRGGKQVAVGDIHVDCKGGGVYYTGLGSESIYVVREFAIEKKKEDELRITLRRTPKGTEIVKLE